MAKAVALENSILFVFTDNVRNSVFEDVSHSGIYLGHTVKSAAETPRWGIVVSIGPEVKEPAIKPGAKVLIEPLMWTVGMEYDGVQIWRTNETKVMCVEEN